MEAAVRYMTSLPEEQGSAQWQYSIVPEDLYQCELGKYCTYGIQLVGADGADILHDVCVSKKTAERIVDLLNYYQVSPIHLCDVVADILP